MLAHNITTITTTQRPPPLSENTTTTLSDTRKRPPHPSIMIRTPSLGSSERELKEVSFWRPVLRLIAAALSLTSALVLLCDDATSNELFSAAYEVWHKPEGGWMQQQQQERTPSLQDREAHMQLAAETDYEHSYYQEPKPTPSGWWPDDLWIHDCVNKERNLKPFDTLEGWVDYRLGDCVKLCPHGCPRDHGDDKIGFSQGLRMLKKRKTGVDPLSHWTIGGEYYDKGCSPHGPGYHTKRGNETLLDEILAGREGMEGFEKPPEDAVVIHLRLGDKIEHSDSTPYEMLQNSADPGFKSFQGLHAVKSVYEFLTNIVESEQPKVVIRGGSQAPEEYVKSKTYAYCLKEAVAEAGYDVEMNLEEGNADKDFYYLTHAKQIIITVGGFSRYIGHIVLRRGGTVYGRVFRRSF